MEKKVKRKNVIKKKQTSLMLKIEKENSIGRRKPTLKSSFSSSNKKRGGEDFNGDVEDEISQLQK